MALVTVPPGSAPGDFDAKVAGPSFCDVGPNPDGDLPPAAWVWVQIVLVKLADGSDPTVARPDAAGRVFHCLWRFAHPAGGSIGQRREWTADWTPPPATPGGMAAVTAADPQFIETDPGCFRVATQANLYFLGGVAGDVYDVQVRQFCSRDEAEAAGAIDVYEPPFKVELTHYVWSQNPDSGAPIFVPFAAPLPLGATHFQVVQGAAGIPLSGGRRIPIDASYGDGGRVPLSTPIVVATGVYRTTGAL
jgi:hypothetical protein